MGVGDLGGWWAGLRIEESRMRLNSGQMRWRSLGRRWFGNRSATWHSPMERMLLARTSPTVTEWLEVCRWMEWAGP